MSPTHPTVLKICGLREIAHLRVAEACGATHVGLIVEVGASPRCLSREQAKVLARAARAKPVIVTTSADPEEVVELARTVQPAVVQHHGAQPLPPARVRQALPGVEFWQVVAVESGPAPDLGRPREAIVAAAEGGADGIVLDTARGGRSGGLGTAMSWDAAARLVSEAGDLPVILAGGLTPGNVAEAMACVRPAGVDVSSGVEAAPGAKSPRLIRAFCEAVRHVTVSSTEA